MKTDKTTEHMLRDFECMRDEIDKAVKLMHNLQRALVQHYCSQRIDQLAFGRASVALEAASYSLTVADVAVRAGGKAHGGKA